MALFTLSVLSGLLGVASFKSISANDQRLDPLLEITILTSGTLIFTDCNTGGKGEWTVDLNN